jgi:hypothetical protein
MAKDIKRRCPACGKTKAFRADVKTCGCRGTNPNINFAPASGAEAAQLAHFRAKTKHLEAAIKKLLADRGKYAELIADLKRAIPAIDPYPAVHVPTKNVTGTKVAAVVKASDWQIGELIDPTETEGFGRFNFSRAEKRVFQLDQKLIDWVGMHRQAGFIIDELHVFSEADLVSGNIHYELEVTNEFPAPIAALKAGRLFAEFVRRLAPHFSKVVVWEVSADNHGRLTRKNQAKQGAKNNFSRIAHEMANEILLRHENVVSVLGDGTKLLANVLGKKFLLSHGHHIMGQMGIPYYGMSRDKAREAVKRMHTDKTFDYISIGHWHVPAIIDGNILVNGNLPGTTEFDHMQGRHAEPSQVSFMVHPKHGIFDWVAWKLD